MAAQTRGDESARINYDCASLILEYDPVSAEALQDILDYVAGIGLDGLEALLSLPPRPSQTSTAGAEAVVAGAVFAVPGVAGATAVLAPSSPLSFLR